MGSTATGQGGPLQISTFRVLSRPEDWVGADDGESPTIKMTIEGWDYDLDVWDQTQQHIGSHQVGYQNKTSGTQRPIRIIKPDEAD